MSSRPTDEEFASYAAKHSLYPEGKPPRLDRLEPLRSQGVVDESSLIKHTHEVIQAPDTRCFRGAYGREVYANDRMNTIVITQENAPIQSTVFNNDNNKLTANQRLEEKFAKRERIDYPGTLCKIRTGGSQALEQDRVSQSAQEVHSISPDKPDPLNPTNPGAAMPFPAQKEPEPDWKAKWASHVEETKVPHLPEASQDDTLAKSKGRSR